MKLELINSKNLFIDKKQIFMDLSHKDKPFLDNEQNKIWIKIQENSFWYDYRNKLILSLLRKYSTNKNVIDVGSGIGTTSLFLQKEGFLVESIEPSNTSCLISKKRGVLKIINSNIFSNNISLDKKNDVNILLLDVLEHIENDGNFLKRILKITKNPTLFITVPAFNILWSFDDNHAFHYRRYKLKEIENLLKKEGFKIKFSSYFFLYLFIPIFLLRSISYRILKNRKQRDRVQYSEYVPNKIFNNIFQYLGKIEIFFINFSFKLPFGSSIVIVAQKNDSI